MILSYADYLYRPRFSRLRLVKRALRAADRNEAYVLMTAEEFQQWRR